MRDEIDITIKYLYVFDFYFTKELFLKRKKYRVTRESNRFINKYDKEGLKNLIGINNIYSFKLLYIDKIEVNYE